MIRIESVFARYWNRRFRALTIVLLATLGWTRVGLAEQDADDPRLLKPPGPHYPVSADQLRDVVSYRSDQPIVGTHFFYWYDVESNEHFIDHDGTDALTDHPTRPDGYSYRSVAWWKRELLDVTASGIDFILPIYWGYPGQGQHDSWSIVGLPPLVQAWEELTAEGKRPPRVGLFYDTSTLRHNNKAYHVDLATERGKRWFYVTIRDYFSFIPPKMWAAVDGRPIIVLYSSDFAAKQDQALFPFVRSEFRRDFATDIFLSKNIGWEGESDRTCSWGGALGLKAYDVASLGPGYDHQAVPGRQPLVVDRERGAFYERQWRQFLSYGLKRRANIVLVETWNEFHEGTDVCDSKEFGRQYIDLTAKYSRQFHDRVVLPRSGPFATARHVEWNAETPSEQRGLSIQSSGDGLMEAVTLASRPCWRTKPSANVGKYAYFNLDDGFLFDEENATLLVTVEYYDQGFDSFLCEYDSVDSASSVRGGAFKAQGSVVECGNTNQWRNVTITVDGGRFANRCNGGDFRFAVNGGDLAIGRTTAKLAKPANGDGK